MNDRMESILIGTAFILIVLSIFGTLAAVAIIDALKAGC